MKVLYGVQATGNGHITRARVMQEAFKAAGLSVDWVFSGRSRESLFDMEVFGDFRCFSGLTFVIENGRINNLKTAFNNNMWHFFRDVSQLNVKDYDLVINDFEPVTAWAAKLKKVPSIGISHQMAFKYDIPKAGSNLLAELIMKIFAPVKFPIGLHWHHYQANILPPLIEDLKTEHETQEDMYLVYYPFVDLDFILERLKPFANYEFHIYHGVDKAQHHGHITVHPFSREGFATHLQQSCGVITGAGFELPSEALLLGKKLLLMPLTGQMEQQSNALAARELGYATVSMDFSHLDIDGWLKQPLRDPIRFPQVAGPLIEWLQEKRWDDITELRDRLWGEVDKPKEETNNTTEANKAAVEIS